MTDNVTLLETSATEKNQLDTLSSESDDNVPVQT